MVVVADSSPLRYLIVLGRQDLLPELLGEIWIPSAVPEELSAWAAPGSTSRSQADRSTR
jgi:predicted nucleic acid-binding protein